MCPASPSRFFEFTFKDNTILYPEDIALKLREKDQTVPYWPALTPVTELIVVLLQPRNNPGGG
jgi:hypothetical protein